MFRFNLIDWGTLIYNSGQNNQTDRSALYSSKTDDLIKKDFYYENSGDLNQKQKKQNKKQRRFKSTKSNNLGV